MLRNGLETRYKRLLALEKKHHEEGFSLTEEQVRLLEKSSPEFRERHVESSKPGELLCQDTFLVGTLKGIGRVYMQAVIDTYCSFSFAKLYTCKVPVTAVDILNDRVLPFYEGLGIKVEAILTDNGREYLGREDRLRMNYSWLWRKLSTVIQRFVIHIRTGLLSALTGLCWMSIFASRVGQNFTRVLGDAERP